MILPVLEILIFLIITFFLFSLTQKGKKPKKAVPPKPNIKTNNIIEKTADDKKKVALSLYEMGKVYFNKEDYKKAAIYFKKAILKDPSNLIFYNSLASVYIKNNKLDKAEAILKKGLRIDEDVQIYHNLGTINYQRERYKRALGYFKKALELEPQNAKRIFRLGLCYEKLDQINEAKDAFEKAVFLDPNNTNYLLALSRVFLKLKNIPQAKAVLKKVLSCDPNNAEAKRQLLRLK